MLRFLDTRKKLKKSKQKRTMHSKQTDYFQMLNFKENKYEIILLNKFWQYQTLNYFVFLRKIFQIIQKITFSNLKRREKKSFIRTIKMWLVSPQMIYLIFNFWLVGMCGRSPAAKFSADTTLLYYTKILHVRKIYNIILTTIYY